jgi:hypothetical protein
MVIRKDQLKEEFTHKINNTVVLLEALEQAKG